MGAIEKEKRNWDDHTVLECITNPSIRNSLFELCHKAQLKCYLLPQLFQPKGSPFLPQPQGYLLCGTEPVVGAHRGKNACFPFTFPHLAQMQGLQSPAAVCEKIQGIKRISEASPRMPERTQGFSMDEINNRAPAEVQLKTGRPPQL